MIFFSNKNLSFKTEKRLIKHRMTLTSLSLISEVSEFPNLPEVLSEAPSGSSPSLILIFITAVLSILGCLFNLGATLYLKLHQNVLGKMVINLSINDFLFTLSFTIMFFNSDPLLSKIAGVIFAITWSGSTAWVCCFAHALYISLGAGEYTLEKYLFKRYSIFTILMSIAVCVGMSIFNFTSEGVEEATTMFLICGLVILSISFLFCAVCYIMVLKKLRENGMQTHLELLLYPFFLIICETPLVFLEIRLMKNYELSATLITFTVICFLSRGFFNALAYGLS